MKMTREKLRVIILALREREKRMTNASRAVEAGSVEEIRELIQELTELRGRTMK